MPEGQPVLGDSEPLTTDTAAPLLDQWFSKFEENQRTESKAPKAPEDEASTEEVEEQPGEAEEPEHTEEPEGELEEPAAEAESEDEEEPASKTPQPKKHKVKVRGVEEEVDEAELLAGYSRTADYTRSKQELANEKRSFDAEKTAVTAERQQLAAKLTTIDQILKAQQEPNWDEIRAKHPDQFGALHAEWQIHKDQLAAVQAEKAKVETKLAEDRAAKITQHVAAEARKFLELTPEWSDSTKQKAGLQQLFEYGQAQGFSPDELNDIGDHRAMVLLRKAMLYDQGQKAAATKKQVATQKIERVRAATPGATSSTKKAPTELARRKAAARKSGTVAAAGDALNALFGLD